MESGNIFYRWSIFVYFTGKMGRGRGPGAWGLGASCTFEEAHQELLGGLSAAALSSRMAKNVDSDYTVRTTSPPLPPSPTPLELLGFICRRNEENNTYLLRNAFQTSSVPQIEIVSSSVALSPIPPTFWNVPEAGCFHIDERQGWKFRASITPQFYHFSRNSDKLWRVIIKSRKSPTLKKIISKLY